MALGRSVEELEATISDQELQEWSVYWQLEPFGSPADDHRFESLLSLIFSAHSESKAKIPTFFDRDPASTERRAYIDEINNRETLEDRVRAMFEARINRQPST